MIVAGMLYALIISLLFSLAQTQRERIRVSGRPSQV
jgi:hypothetical protein